MLPTLIIVFLLGLTLLLLARRGRRIDDHPLCYNCKFDLVGNPPESHRCPECGSFLTGVPLPRGNRRRSPFLFYWGAWLTTISALAIAFYFFLAVSGASPMPYKPLYLLRWDLANPDQSTAAAREILSRTTAGSLTESDLAPAIDELLTWQQDLHRPWSPQFGQIIETAYARKLISAPRWEKYVANMFPEFSIRTRSRFHSADVFYLQISFGHPRNGATVFTASSLPVDVDADINFSSPLKFHWPLSASSFSPYGTVSVILPGELPALPVASYHYTIEYTLTIHHPSRITPLHSGLIPFNFEIVPPATPVITFLHDPATRDALIHSIELETITRAVHRPREIQCPSLWFPINTSLELLVVHPPVTVSFTAELVQGGIRWPFDTTTHFYVGPLNENGAEILHLDLNHRPASPFSAGPAKIIFCPDFANLLQTPDIDTTFGDPIVMPITILPPK